MSKLEVDLITNRNATSVKYLILSTLLKRFLLND